MLKKEYSQIDTLKIGKNKEFLFELVFMFRTQKEFTWQLVLPIIQPGQSALSRSGPALFWIIA